MSGRVVSFTVTAVAAQLVSQSLDPVTAVPSSLE